MEPSTDLRAGLGVLFLDEPRGRSVEEQIRAGRRRLRLRRTAMAVGAAVIGMAVVSGFSLADRSPSTVGPVTKPTRTVDPSTAAVTKEMDLVTSLVKVDEYGHLTVAPGVQVVRRVDNFLDLPAPYTTDAVEVRKGDAHYVFASSPGGFGFAKADEQTLDELIAERSGLGMLSYRAPGPMPLNIWEWGEDGLPIVFDPGVKVLRTIDNPFHVAPPRRSVAMVIRGGAHTWWAYWEVGPSGYQGAMRSTEARSDQTLRAWLDIYGVETTW